MSVNKYSRESVVIFAIGLSGFILFVPTGIEWIEQAIEKDIHIVGVLILVIPVLVMLSLGLFFLSSILGVIFISLFLSIRYYLAIRLKLPETEYVQNYDVQIVASIIGLLTFFILRQMIFVEDSLFINWLRVAFTLLIISPVSLVLGGILTSLFKHVKATRKKSER